MKKTIIVLIAATSFLSVKAQTNISQKAYVNDAENRSLLKSDTTFTDSTKYISNQDINNYLNQITDKVTVKQYNDFLAILQGIIAVSRKDWETKNKKK